MPPITIHPLVPEFILQQFRAGVRRGEFDGVGMFVDISGFSKMTETFMDHGQHGAEILATVMRDVFTPLIETVHENGGFIATLAGDAFTALFPFERAADTGPVCEDVVQAAWAIQQYISTNPRHETPYGSHTISVKVGIAMGKTMWGIVTSEDESRAAYFFRGSAVEDCALAEHAAQSGEIILDSLVCEEAPVYAQIEPHGIFFRLKGLGDTDEFATDPSLKSATITLPTEPGEIIRFFPKSLVMQEHIGEFRQVVNLFIQIPTLRTESQLEAFLRAIFLLQNRYGGLLNRVDFGDKGTHLLMFWGAPIAYRNDIARALNFVLDLQTQTSLPFTAGLTYRISHAGFIGSSLREEYTCYGRGVNLAVRFMTTAPRGDIWVDEEIFNRVEAQFEIEPLGAMAFKGFLEPQKAYRLLERREQTESSFQGAFVGREREISALMDFIHPLKAGHYAGALIITGEAGIGKSRLVNAFQKSDAFLGMESRPLVALCQNDENIHEAFDPFHYWLRGYFGQSALQGEIKNKRNFTRKLDELVAATPDPALADELDRTRSFLGALLDLFWPDSLYAQLEGKARFENTLIGLITLIQAESLRQPLILLIEDVQWLDADSRTLIPRLVRTLSASDSAFPIAILATARIESATDPAGMGSLLGEGLHPRVMPLTTFGRNELEALAESVLQARPAQELLDLLEDRAEGNPFFSEQVLRYLQENGDLEMRGSGEIGVHPDRLAQKTSFLPTDVRVLLVARLDQLTSTLRDLVQAASVLGREFEVRVLIGMLHDEEMVTQKIDQGVDLGIWEAISQLRYLFRHALLRDAAYRMQVHSRRRILHRLALEALEMLFSNHLAPHYGALGYHAEQARLDDKARHYLQKAGDAAKEAYQNGEALDYYSRALALTPDGMNQEKVNLLLERESIYHNIGKRDEQLKDLKLLEALSSLLQNPSTEAKILHKKARYFEAIGSYDLCLQETKRVVDLAVIQGDKALAARAFIEWGTAFWWQGNYAESEEKANQALGLYENLQDDEGIAEVLYLLGESATKTGHYDLAFSHYERVLAINRRMGKLNKELSTLNSLGVLMNHQQKYTQARNYFEQARELCIKSGNQKGLGMVANNLGTIAHFLGQYDRAIQAYQEALRISREAGVRTEEAIALNNLGEVAFLQENHSSAKTYLEHALAIEHELNIPHFEAHTMSKYGVTLLVMGDDRAAEQSFRHVIGIRQKLGQTHLEVVPRLGLAQIALSRQDERLLRDSLEFVVDSLSNHPPDGFEDPLSLFWDAYVILDNQDDPRANQVLREACGLLETQAARIPDEESRQSFLLNVPVNRKISAACSS